MAFRYSISCYGSWWRQRSSGHIATLSSTGVGTTRRALLVLAGLDALCGLANGLLLGAHLAAVLGRAMKGAGFLGAPAFSYDFTFKSLILVGVTGALPGFLCLAQARGLTRGERSAWSSAFGWSLWLLAFNAFFWKAFAPLLALLAFLNLLGLVAARRRFQAYSGSSAEKGF